MNFLIRSRNIAVAVAVFVHFLIGTCCSMIIRDLNNDVPVDRQCIINDNRNTSGVCKLLTACPAVIGLLRAGINPTTCSSEGRGVVCCPLNHRISTKKCKEFTKVLTEPLKAKEALVYNGTLNTKKSEDNSIKCEAFLVENISGGRKAKLREYPYQAAIGYGNDSKPDWRCGGTLIDPQYVLTAGHCAVTSFGPPKVVLLGDRKLSSRKDHTRKVVEVSEIYLHPDYKSPLQYNDIAIIKFKTAVPISRSVLPACLPNPEERLDRALSVEATGWGQTGAYEGQSDVLQSVILGKLDKHDCSGFFESDDTNKERLPKGILPSQFCAGDKEGIRDTCKGDSGGPVTVSSRKAECVHYIVGITSFGSAYCGFQQPGVYTNVLAYLDWIEDIVWYNLSTTRTGAQKLYTKISSKNRLILSPSPEETTTSQPPKQIDSGSNTIEVENDHRNETIKLEDSNNTVTQNIEANTTQVESDHRNGTIKLEDSNNTVIHNIEANTIEAETPSTTTVKIPLEPTTSSMFSYMLSTIPVKMPSNNSFDGNLFNIPSTIADLLNRISKR